MFEKHFQRLPIIIFKFLVNDDVVDDPAVQMSKRNKYRLPQKSRLDDSRNKRFRVIKEQFQSYQKRTPG